MRPSREKFQENLRRALLARRGALIAQRDASDEGARGLYDEPEPDWEDRAANLAAARRLTQLGESEREQLLLVQKALQRIDDGTWGRCVTCGRPIGKQRLRAVPEASTCTGCAS
jgi:DnaK suppressor protein